MAVLTHRNSNPVTTNAPATYVSGAFTPAVNELLIAMVSVSGYTGTPTVTDNQSGTYTHIASVLRSTSAHITHVYVRTALVASAVSHTVTATATFTGSTGAVVAVASVSGMTKTGALAVRQSATRANRPAAETPEITFASACLTGNVVIGMVGNATNPAGLTPPATFGEDLDTGYNTPAQGFEYVSVDSGFTGTLVTWGNTSASAFGGIAIELDTTAGTVYNQNNAGALSFGGALVKVTTKPATGAVSFGGALVRTPTKAVVGVASFAGALIKRTTKPLAGAVSFAGAVVASRVTTSALAGSLSFSGSLAKTGIKVLSGGVSFTGALARSVTRPVAGAVSFAGSIARVLTFFKANTGVLNFASGTTDTVHTPGAPAAVGVLTRIQTVDDPVRYT